jgi:hypothetical protein
VGKGRKKEKREGRERKRENFNKRAKRFFFCKNKKK